MTDRVCILVAGIADDVVAGLQAHRADWAVVSLDTEPGNRPAGPLPWQGRVFALVGWLLPTMSGLEMCRRLRGRPETAPEVANAHITLVLDPDDVSARRRALAAGADDYMLAPLDAAAVIARIEDLAQTRHSAQTQSVQTQSVQTGRRSAEMLVHRGLEVDPAAFMVRHADRAVRLRRNEFDILMHFMRRPNQVLSRQALVDQIGKGGMIGERTVDRRIARLRKTLEDNAIEDPIRTVYGVGYVFDTVE
jgi:two-component system phosphate regulon response regulator PhoB